MHKLNYPITTPEAIKLWGSEHVCNRMKAIIAFSLDLDNANDNLRRFGYTLQWRKRALAAFGQYVSTPDAVGIPYSEMSDFYWNEMPILDFPLGGFDLPTFIDALKYTKGSVIGGKSMYMPTQAVVMAYVEETGIDLPEDPSAKWDKFRKHSEMMRDKAEMEKADLIAKAEAHKLAREAQFIAERRAEFLKKGAAEKLMKRKQAIVQRKREERELRKSKAQHWVNKWQWEHRYWERSKNKTVPCEHAYDRWSLEPCSPTGHWFDGEFNLKPQFAYSAYKCGWQPDGIVPELQVDLDKELAVKAADKKRWELAEARRIKQELKAKKDQEAHKKVEKQRKEKEREERKKLQEEKAIKRKEAKESERLAKLERDRNRPNYSVLSCPAPRL